jgi:hypothetical protein
MPPKRTSTARGGSRSFADEILPFSLRKRRRPRFWTGGFQRSLPHALAQARRAMPATDFYTCRRTSLPRTVSRPKHHNRYSPFGNPPKPGTGTTLLSRGGLAADQRAFSIARTSPRRDLAVVSLDSLMLSSHALCATLVRLGKRSRLCRRATDEEYPGRRCAKGARRRGPCLRRRLLPKPRRARPPAAEPAHDFKPPVCPPFFARPSSANPPTWPRPELHYVRGNATAR